MYTTHQTGELLCLVADLVQVRLLGVLAFDPKNITLVRGAN